MAVIEQEITDRWAVYNGDCCEVLPSLPPASIGFSVYSPPFAGMFHYSSSERDLSNCSSYAQFLEHYEFVVEQVARVTMPGRISAVHCMDFADGSDLEDLPGDIIRIHQRHGFIYHDRKTIWKEPLRVAMRTRALGLRHSQLVKDSTLCRSALADYVLAFRKKGTNRDPVRKPRGLSRYAGSDSPPPDLVEKFRGWPDPKTNKLSHWIWQRYASSVWYDVRIGRVLPYKPARETEEEKHIHPLQLDTIERCVTLWSNEGDRVLSPFSGVGSEIYTAVRMRRFGVGVELKPSFFRQQRANLRLVDLPDDEQASLLSQIDAAEGEVVAEDLAA
jgi:DNA modification methylase